MFTLDVRYIVPPHAGSDWLTYVVSFRVEVKSSGEKVQVVIFWGSGVGSFGCATILDSPSGLFSACCVQLAVLTNTLSCCVLLW